MPPEPSRSAPLLALVAPALLALGCTSPPADGMTVARLEEIVRSARVASAGADLAIYPPCERMTFSVTTTLPSGASRVDAGSAREWFVSGDYLVIESPLADRSTSYEVKSYDPVNRLYHGWGFAAGRMLFTQSGVYDAEHRIMCWHTDCQGEQSGYASVSIQRFVSATRIEWLMQLYKDGQWCLAQSGSCDVALGTAP
jgi:hypothetical protein